MLHEIDLSRADLNLLVLFDTVMETRHVGRAAARLSLSPSAVSHGLARLRGMLGDPLFFRTPKGVVPTDRAEQLAPLVSDILARVRGVVAGARPFDPAASRRRFVIGAPDGAAAVFLPALQGMLRDVAPGVDLGVRQILPRAGELAPDLAWRDALAELEARAVDLLVIPRAEAPARFCVRPLYEEDFVVAMRAGHRLAADPSLEAYAAASHLVVSETGDATGFVDLALAERGLSRRVALTAPNFMFALALLADSDLVAAVPRRLVEAHGARFGIVCRDAPVALPRFRLCLIMPQVALNDTGLAWLAGRLERCAGG
jgi:DNA-binding transcriptional LysR family regulator